jgi:hypothetical protein
MQWNVMQWNVMRTCLEIAMNDSSLVTVTDRIDNLAEENPRLCLGQWTCASINWGVLFVCLFT